MDKMEVTRRQCTDLKLQKSGNRDETMKNVGIRTGGWEYPQGMKLFSLVRQSIQIMHSAHLF